MTPAATSSIRVGSQPASTPTGSEAQPAPKAATTAPTLAVSIVIPTYRRPDLIERCVAAAIDQTLDPGRYEVIVVDDGHDARTESVVARIAERSADVAIRYLRPASGHGPAVARNCGWRAARGEVVAFTDDDTVPARGWLAEGRAQLLAHAEWAGLCGRVRVPLEEGVAPTDHERMTQGLETAQFVTANAFVRRAALEQVGGFDERFKRAWHEDSDLHFRLLEEVGGVGRAGAALVVHPVRAERWGVSLRQQKNAFFDALLFKKHPRLYRERIHAAPPWDYYAIVVASLAAAAFVVTGEWPAALVAAAIAIGFIAAFAWRRLKATRRTPAHVIEMVATSALIPFLSVYWRLRGALHFRVMFW